MNRLSTLVFEPIFRRYVWGGRRLETVLGKRLPPGDDYAESWEVVDHGEDQSVVASGPWAGRTLGWLREHHGEELLGTASSHERFPLLLKYLDARRDLSVQVHPDDRHAARLEPPDLGKTECWVILHADPGSRIYAGLRRGADRRALESAARSGDMESCLHHFEPRVGDCVFIPAGVVHAIGAGLLLAEVQQSSDTTFRLFDWNRLGQDGRPRPLHVEQALEVIDFEHGPVRPQTPEATGRDGVERLVECEKFVVDRHRLSAPTLLGENGRMHIVSVTRGRITIEGDGSEVRLDRGGTALLPACQGPITVTGEDDARILDVFLPA